MKEFNVFNKCPSYRAQLLQVVTKGKSVQRRIRNPEIEDDGAEDGCWQRWVLGGTYVGSKL